MAIPSKVSERISSALKRLQPVLSSAKSRDINESDTARIVTDLLSELFGYDRYSEITSEFAIRGTYCDLAIKIDGKLQNLIEVKAIGLELKEQHVKQAVDYAANEGVEWVILTNGCNWKVFKVGFSKPITQELVLDLDLLSLSHRTYEHVECLFLLSKEAASKAHLVDYHSQLQAMNRFTIAALILSDPIVAAIRKELRRLSPGVKIEPEQLMATIENEVLKRDVVDGEKAIDAKKKIQRAFAKSQKAMAATASGGMVTDSSPDSDAPLG
jgi:hypothetical protein